MKSIINHLGTEEFCRLRVGIGHPASNNSERRTMTVSHVLGNFNSNESKLISNVLNEVVLGLDLIQKVGFEKAANFLNSIQTEINEI